MKAERKSAGRQGAAPQTAVSRHKLVAKRTIAQAPVLAACDARYALGQGANRFGMKKQTLVSAFSARVVGSS